MLRKAACKLFAVNRTRITLPDGQGGRENRQTTRAATSTTPVRQLLGMANAPAVTNTAPVHQRRGSANAETTPAEAPAAAADTTQRPNAACEGKNRCLSRAL